MTPDEFGAKIKEKYPDYASVDNTELSRRIIAKHPEYASQVEFKDAPNDAPAQSPNILGRAKDAIMGAGALVNPGGYLADKAAQVGMDTNVPRALLTNEPTQGLGESLLRSAPATIGGIVGAGAGMGLASIPGAGLGGAAGESARQGAAQLYAGAAGRQFTSPTDVLKNVGIQGATQAGGQALNLGAAALINKVGPSVVKGVSQLTRAFTGTPENEAAALLRDPAILSRARPMDEAGKLYRAGVGDAADGSMEAGRAIFGKTYPGPEAAVNTFDEVRGALDAAKPNELLGMRQTMMDTLSDTPHTSPKLRKMLSERIDVLDGLLEGKLPDWGGAKQAWRDSKVAESFNSWLPLNKNLSPNALRTTAAVATAANAAGEGKFLGLAALPLISPKVWGTGIRAMGALGQIPAPVYRVGVQAAAGATGSALQQAYMGGR